MKRISRFDTIDYLQFNNWSDSAIESMIELRNIVDYLHQRGLNIGFNVDTCSDSVSIKWKQSGLEISLWIKSYKSIDSNLVRVVWIDKALNQQEEDFEFKCFDSRIKPFLYDLLTSKGVVEPVIVKHIHTQ